MTKSEVKQGAKTLSKNTKFKIRQYVLLTESVLLGIAGVLAVTEAYKLHEHNAVFYLAAVAGAYALIEALHKLDKAISQK